jgi:hypothetical protein
LRNIQPQLSSKIQHFELVLTVLPLRPTNRFAELQQQQQQWLVAPSQPQQQQCPPRGGWAHKTRLPQNAVFFLLLRQYLNPFPLDFNGSGSGRVY